MSITRISSAVSTYFNRRVTIYVSQHYKSRRINFSLRTKSVRTDAAKLCDRLVENGLTGSSVLRLFTTVKSIFNFACIEAGLEISNLFAGLYLDREQGVSVRKPIPVPVIKRVQAECIRSDDPLRWAAALLSNKSMRIVSSISQRVGD